MNFINRTIEKKLIESIETRPLTYLNGGRQVGKSTLCSIINSEANRITFDSPLVLSAAKYNPEFFVNSLPEHALNIIDEAQFAPEIFPYLKMKIDQNRLEGKTEQKFLLTGSANILAMPALSDAFVGRMSILTLYPFASSEIYNSKMSVTDKFLNEALKIKRYENYDVLEVIKNATYPEIAVNKSIDRIKWFDSYLTTILTRDIKSVSDLKNSDLMVALLSLLSMNTGGLVNNSGISRELGVDYRTYEKMIAYAVNSFLIFSIKPWSKPNKLKKRYVKSPKLYFTDCNFLSYIMKRSLDDIYQNDYKWFGHIFENFVASELLKHCKINNIELSHFRTASGNESDFVLEDTNGKIVGIEVKSSSSIDVKTTSGLYELQNICGDKFEKGIILYTGKEVIPLKDKIWAVPVCCLWE